MKEWFIAGWIHLIIGFALGYWVRAKGVSGAIAAVKDGVSWVVSKFSKKA